MFQRVIAAIMLVHLGVIHLSDASFSVSMLPGTIGSCAGLLLLVGFWTPVAGTLIAVVELWIAFTHLSDPSIPVILATIGGTLAILEPGTFSVDGRRHLDV